MNGMPPSLSIGPSITSSALPSAGQQLWHAFCCTLTQAHPCLSAHSTWIWKGTWNRLHPRWHSIDYEQSFASLAKRHWDTRQTKLEHIPFSPDLPWPCTWPAYLHSQSCWLDIGPVIPSSVTFTIKSNSSVSEYPTRWSAHHQLCKPRRPLHIWTCQKLHCTFQYWPWCTACCTMTLHLWPTPLSWKHHHPIQHWLHTCAQQSQVLEFGRMARWPSYSS